MPDNAVLSTVDAALRGLLLAQLLLLAGVLARDRPRLPAAQAGLLICAGLAVQVVSSTPLFETRVPWQWQMPGIAVSVANAVLFWVFVQALFDDAFRWRWWHGAGWLAAAAVAGCHCLWGPGGGTVATLLGVAQRAVPVVCTVGAAVAAARHWRDDLVEGRRRLRVFIVATGAAYTLAMLAARLAAPRGQLSPLVATLDVAALLAMMSVITARLLRLTPTELFPSTGAVPPPLLAVAARPQLLAAAAGPALALAEGAGNAAQAAAAPAASPFSDPSPDPKLHPGADPTAGAQAAPLPQPDAAETRLADKLQQLMADQRAYRSEDLSLARLADKLGVPEYRLRRLINQRLGHRNFSAYVNGFRLAEARAALADPAQRHLPVLTIALTAGFQSIGPFNRAFKADTGLTPTEFRRQNSADS